MTTNPKMPEPPDPRARAARASRLWAVTSYYNPAGYRRRLANYRVFRRELRAPLLAVEWSPTGEFELGPGDADLLLQIAGGDVMWQKERLLNLGIERLPPVCDCVAWLDCDVVFARQDWAERAIAALDDATLVQLFDRVVHAPRTSLEDLAGGDAWRRGAPIRERRSAASVYRQALAAGDLSVFARAPAGQPFASPASTGHAWAARRESLRRHPLFEDWVIGGGDAAYAYAAAGLAREQTRMRELTPAHGRRYLLRARALSGHVDGRLSHLSGDLLHLWHGEPSDRRYQQRFSILRRHGFDPSRHLAQGEGGAWRWSAGFEALAADVDAYFRSRFEDGRPSPSASTLGPAGPADGP